MWFVLAQKCKSVPLSLAENFGFSNYSFFLFSCALNQWMVVLFPEIFLFRCCRRRFTRCRGSDPSSKPWTACNILGRAYSIVLRSIRFRRLFISQSRLQKSLESHWTSKPPVFEWKYGMLITLPIRVRQTPNDAFHSANPPPPKISNRTTLENAQERRTRASRVSSCFLHVPY
jgi:hypothetical protein